MPFFEFRNNFRDKKGEFGFEEKIKLFFSYDFMIGNGRRPREKSFLKVSGL